MAATPEFKMTGISVQGGNVIVRWQGGVGPYQVLCRTNLTEGWRKLGQPTTGFAATNPQTPGPMCFYMVTTDVTPPVAPTGLRATPNSCSQLLLSWNASSDNVGGSGIKGYNIYRNGILLKQVPPSTNSIMENGLAGSTSYTYSVSAVDMIGNQSTQTVLVATTPACSNQLPTADAGPDKTGVMGRTVTFDGSGSRDPDGTIISYAWNFGDGATASGMTVSHTYANCGNFTARLTVTDSSGGTASDSNLVTVVTNGQFMSVTKLGGTDSDTGQAVTIDRSGNLFIGGTSAGRPSLAKCSPAGSLQWSLNFGPGSGALQALATDSGGNVYVTGNFYGSEDLGGVSLTSAGGYDIFVAKFSPAGGCLWGKRFGSAKIDTIVTESGFGISVDTNNDVVVTGMFDGTVDFGGGPLVSVTGQDMFLTKFSSAGVHLWSRRVGGSSAIATGNSVATDINGNIFVTGAFGSTVDFGSGAVASIGAKDLFIAKYSPGGNLLWVTNFGTRTPFPSQSAGAALAVDSSGSNVVVTGTLQSTMSLGGGILTNAGYQDAFIAKYSGRDGRHLWSKAFGGLGPDYGNGIALDPSGNVTFTGRVVYSVDFGGGLLPAVSGQNAFVANFSANGAHRWSKVIGAGHEEGKAVAADRDGHCFVIGRFGGTVDFGGGGVTALGGSDIFVAEFQP